MQNALSFYLFILTISIISVILFYNSNTINFDKNSFLLFSRLEENIPMFDIKNPSVEVYFSLNKTVIDFDMLALQKIPLRYWIIYFIQDNKILYRNILFSENLGKNDTYVEIRSEYGNFEIKSSDIAIPNSINDDIYSVHIEIYDSALISSIKDSDKIAFRLFIYPFYQDIFLNCHHEPYGLYCI
jgi:hypothetical protein